MSWMTFGTHEQEGTMRPGTGVAAALAVLSDCGTVLETITSPADAVVLFLTSSPAVEAGGLLLGLGAV